MASMPLLSGQAKVHESDVGLKFAKVPDALGGGGGLRYQQHVRLTGDDCRDPLAQKRMVVDGEHSDLSLIWHEFIRLCHDLRLPVGAGAAVCENLLSILMRVPDGEIRTRREPARSF